MTRPLVMVEQAFRGKVTMALMGMVMAVRAVAAAGLTAPSLAVTAVAAQV
jgi:microcompartment protein CcmL/EutN